MIKLKHILNQCFIILYNNTLNNVVKLQTTLFLLLTLGTINCHAQKSGETVYQFVEIATSAHTAALGGSPLALASAYDLSHAITNPAFLSYINEQRISLDYTNYVAGIAIGQAATSLKFNSIPGTIGISLQYLNSGQNIRYDNDGNKAGEFSSNEFALNLSYSQKFGENLSMGATFKPILSYIGGYSSFGLLADFAVGYNFSNNQTTMSLLLRNMGAQITSYHNQHNDIPFEIQMAISQKLKHAPFRIYIVFQHLQKYNLTTNDKNPPHESYVITKDNASIPNFADNLLRHTILGLEAFPDKPFSARLGLNYKRRQELKIKDAPGGAGLSFGFALHLKRFHLDYANTRYSIGGRSNHFSLAFKFLQ